MQERPDKAAPDRFEASGAFGRTEAPDQGAPCPATGAWLGRVRAVLTKSESFPLAVRALFGAAVLAVICGWAAIPYALRAPGGCDDVGWAKRALYPWWFAHERKVLPEWRSEFRLHLLDNKWEDPAIRDYSYCVEHPAVARMIYRQVLHAAGVYRIDQEAWDLSAPTEVNVNAGRLLDERTRNTLRMTNFGFFLAGVLLAYFSFCCVLRNAFLALVVAIPLAIEPTAIRDNVAVVTYVGTDAILSFWVAAAWSVLLMVKKHRLWSVLVLAVLGGLATATKLNGAFVLPGLAAFLVYDVAGRRRFLYPAIMILVAVLVFFTLNPVYIGTSPSWTLRSISDMLYVRTVVQEWVGTRTGTFTRLEALTAVFPYVFLLLPIAGVLVLSRRQEWFARAALLAASVILFNDLTAPGMLARYAFPVRQAFWLIFLPCAGFAAIRLWDALAPARRASGAVEHGGADR